jgi:hypothetical protein
VWEKKDGRLFVGLKAVFDLIDRDVGRGYEGEGNERSSGEVM